VIVGARLPSDELYWHLNSALNTDALHLAGDAVSPGTIQSAVLSGHTVARTILGTDQNISAYKREQLIVSQ